MHETTVSRSFRLQPLTASICVVATGASLWWWAGGSADAWFMDFRGLRGQGWRLFSSCLLHVNWLHLLLNLYWVGVFGERIEIVFGQVRTAGIVAVIAVGSSAAEYGFANSGVGLSGVVYGMFGLLWVLSRRDERFHGSVGPKTILLFLLWGAMCVILSVAGTLQIGNVAHVAGLGIGILLAFIIKPNWRNGRQHTILGLAILLSVILAAASFARPYLNFTGDVGYDLAAVGYTELGRGNNKEAEILFRRAVAIQPQLADWQYNLGASLAQLERHREAIAAFERAYKLAPENNDFRNNLAAWSAWQAGLAKDEGHVEQAAALYEKSFDLNPSDPEIAYQLAICYRDLGRIVEARAVVEKMGKVLEQHPNHEALIESLSLPD